MHSKVIFSSMVLVIHVVTIVFEYEQSESQAAGNSRHVTLDNS